jgi:hypothetical protein
MFPPKDSGLEHIIKSLDKLQKANINRVNIQNPFERLNKEEFVSDINSQLKTMQLQARELTQGIRSALTSLVSGDGHRNSREDYESVVYSFLPHNATLIRPSFPVGSDAVLVSDINNDNNPEIIFTYRDLDNSLNTCILETENGMWINTMQINSSDAEELHYRNAIDLAGNGTKNLVLGISASDGSKLLQGFSYLNGQADLLFERSYDKLEIINSQSQNAPGRQIALWNDDNEGSWDVEVLRWDGIQLEQINPQEYYDRMVIPALVQKARLSPNKPGAFYQLADFLGKAGHNKDARDIINYVLSQSRSEQIKEKFNELSNRY